MKPGTTSVRQLGLHANIHGAERSLVNNLHDWLIFMVRFLSREYIYKGKGQEALWSKRNEPSWWMKEVSLEWKNPTQNPKDTNENLVKKCKVLMTHLQQENRFPQDVEDEVKLWESGELNKLFCLISYKSWFSRATNLYTEMRETLEKVECKKMTEPPSLHLLDDIRQKLSLIVELIERTKSSATSCDKNNSIEDSNGRTDDKTTVLPINKKLVTPVNKDESKTAIPVDNKTLNKRISSKRKDSTASIISTATAKRKRKCEAPEDVTVRKSVKDTEGNHLVLDNHGQSAVSDTSLHTAQSPCSGVFQINSDMLCSGSKRQSISSSTIYTRAVSESVPSTSIQQPPINTYVSSSTTSVAPSDTTDNNLTSSGQSTAADISYNQLENVNNGIETATDAHDLDANIINNYPGSKIIELLDSPDDIIDDKVLEDFLDNLITYIEDYEVSDDHD